MTASTEQCAGREKGRDALGADAAGEAAERGRPGHTRHSGFAECGRSAR
jgi:hypothetical protein